MRDALNDGGERNTSYLERLFYPMNRSFYFPNWIDPRAWIIGPYRHPNIKNTRPSKIAFFHCEIEKPESDCSTRAFRL